jgi:YbbR domain-containing protein
MMGFFRHFFRHYVLYNFWLKALSLALATGLWFSISRDQQPAVMAIRVPIEFRHLPPDLEISSETVPEAQVRLQGPERLMRQLRPTDVSAEIDVGDAKAGERTFNLSSLQIHQPRELTVEQVVPAQVHLAFDTRLTREVDIHPRVTGNFVAGDAIVKVETDPDRITIAGPRHHVERVDAATTDPLDVSGTRGRATFTTNVYVADPLVQVVRPAAVHVTVTVGKIGDASGH